MERRGVEQESERGGAAGEVVVGGDTELVGRVDHRRGEEVDDERGGRGGAQPQDGGLEARLVQLDVAGTGRADLVALLEELRGWQHRELLEPDASADGGE